jgi:hypothetical protein
VFYDRSKINATCTVQALRCLKFDQPMQDQCDIALCKRCVAPRWIDRCTINATSHCATVALYEVQSINARSMTSHCASVASLDVRSIDARSMRHRTVQALRRSTSDRSMQDQCDIALCKRCVARRWIDRCKINATLHCA